MRLAHLVFRQGGEIPTGYAGGCGGTSRYLGHHKQVCRQQRECHDGHDSSGQEDAHATQRLPHLLLYGPPGTGKTSTILALARRIYGIKNMRQMVLELNASDDRGIEVVREQIKTFASASRQRCLR